MSFGDLKLHGHSYLFFQGVNQSYIGTTSIANHKFYRDLRHEFMVPGVNNP
jgi:hypothetical protein